jgi:hypothetical protein
VVVSVNNRKTNALCDTSATVSCISQSFLIRHLGIKKPKLENSPLKSIFGEGGTRHSVSGFVKIDLSFGSMKLNYHFYVIKDLHHSVILGMDFFRLP